MTMAHLYELVSVGVGHTRPDAASFAQMRPVLRGISSARELNGSGLRSIRLVDHGVGIQGSAPGSQSGLPFPNARWGQSDA